MGNDNSKSSNESDDDCDWDEIGRGCGETVRGSNENEIKKCKIICLDKLIEKLKSNKDRLQKEVGELKKKLNRLKEPALSAAESGIGK